MTWGKGEGGRSGERGKRLEGQPLWLRQGSHKGCPYNTSIRFALGLGRGQAGQELLHCGLVLFPVQIERFAMALAR